MDQRLPIHKYRRIRNEPSQKTEENVIRLKARPRAFVYAAYAGKLLFEGKHNIVILNATGPATFKAIQTVEFLRHRVKGLHAAYNIESTIFEDKYEPREEGLDPVTLNRNVPTITVKLTLIKGDEIKNHRGYMTPLAEDKLLDEQKFRREINDHFSKPRVEGDNEERRGGRGFRGYRGVRRGNYNRDRDDRRDDRDINRDYRRPRRGDRDERPDDRNLDNDHRRPRRGDRDDRDHREPRRSDRDDRDHREPRRGDREDRDFREPRRGYRQDRDHREPRRSDRDYREPIRGDREERNHREPRRGDREDRDHREPRRGDREDRYPREPRRGDGEDRDFRGRGRGGYRNDYRENMERNNSSNARGSNRDRQ